MKIRFKVEPSKYPDIEGTHIIFRYYQTKYGLNISRVFKGTYKECLLKLKELR